LVQVNLVIMSGNGDDPAGLFGLANLTAAMLDEGAGNRSALELADSVEFLGASLSTSSTFDSSSIRLNVPVDAAAGGAAADGGCSALRPTFPEKELQRLRDERLTALLQARDDAGSVANAAFARAVFGTSHRYGTGPTGTEAALKAFTPQNLKDFHAAMYQPTNAMFIVVGDVTASAILPQFEKSFSNWRGRGSVTHPALPQPLRWKTRSSSSTCRRRHSPRYELAAWASRGQHRSTFRLSC
jgi:predicted Zn-dependent peptidase